MSQTLGAAGSTFVNVYNSGTTVFGLGTPSFSSAGSSGFSYAGAGNCPATLGINASCQFQLAFTPAADGLVTDTMSIADTTSGATFSLPLSGYGLPNGPSVSPTSLTFSTIPVGTTSAPQSVTVTRPAGHPITTSGASFTKGSCLPDEVPCILQIVFGSTTQGTTTGTVKIFDPQISSSANFATVTVTGTTVPTINVSPTSLTFPLRGIGTTSIPVSITLANPGNAPVAVTITPGGPALAEYTVSNNCAGSVAASSNCSITVHFAPITPGTKNASVTISGTGAFGLPVTVPITGSAQ